MRRANLLARAQVPKKKNVYVELHFKAWLNRNYFVYYNLNSLGPVEENFRTVDVLCYTEDSLCSFTVQLVGVESTCQQAAKL